MGRTDCAVSGCGSSKNGVSSMSFYKIFAVKRDVGDWISFCRNPMLSQNSVICARHFKDSDFYNPANRSQGLYLHAKPSLFPGEGSQEEKETNAPPVQTHHRATTSAFEQDPSVPASMPENVEVVGEIEIEPSKETTDPEIVPTSKSAKKIDDNLSNDHDDYADVGEIVKCMERLVEEEKKTADLRKKLKNKQKHISKLKAKIRALKETTTQLKTSLKKHASKLYDPILLELQKNKNQKLRGARYSDQMRNMAIVLHYCSSKAYQQMRKYFTLPSVGTIKRWLSRVEIKEGFSTVVLKLLKFKAAGLPKDERVVTIFIDEMSVSQRLTYCANAKVDYFMGFPTKAGHEDVNIDQRASSALAIMVKSIKSGFKQAIGYFFNTSSAPTSRIKTIVEEAIRLVTQTGLIPKVLVCDQNSTNRSLFKTFGVSKERPWFETDGTKIFCAYDACHLIKSSRNNLLHHNAVMDGKICSFQHIVELYHLDMTNFPREVPNLDIDHIELAPYAEMRVNLAVQTLSESVSAGFKTYVHLEKLPDEYMATAAYCECFDKLFDCANSSTFNETKELKRPIQDNSAHWEFFNTMKQKLERMRYISDKCLDLDKEHLFPKLPAQSRRPYFVDGWLLYIAAIEELWKDLRANYGFSFLRTRNLSQDCLEHFFSLVRWKNCNNNHPDPSKFSSAYKSIVINQLMAPKKLGNVEADLNKYFVNSSEMAKANIILNDQPLNKKNTTKTKEPNIKMNDSQSNAVHYTSGWVSTKLKHAECIARMHADKGKVSQQASIFLNFKKFKPNSPLRSPGLKMFKFCKKIVSLFERNFESFLKQSIYGVKRKLIDLLFWQYQQQNCCEGDQQLVYELLCIPCAQMIANKYINMLIKAKLQKMNTKSKVANKLKRKRNKDKKVEAKRRKLNIST